MVVLSEYLAIMRVLILTLQLLVQIVYWQVRLPELVYMVLYELKRMVQGELIDDLEISNQIVDFIGLEANDSNLVDRMNEQKKLSDLSLAVNYGVSNILFTLFFILIVITILVAHRISHQIKKPSWTNRTDRWMRAIFFNSFITYTIFEALKLNIAGMIAINGSEVIIAGLVLATINILPALYTSTLYKRREVLGANKNVESIGSLFSGKNVNRSDHQVYLQPLYFMYRRTIIAFVTVFFQNYPNMQMTISITLSLATIVMMAADQHMFASKGQRFIEITSESLHLVIIGILQQFTIPGYSAHIENFSLVAIITLLVVH